MDDIDLDVNLEDVDSNDDYIKPGRYLLKVEELERKFSKSGDKEFISAVFRTVDTQDADSEKCLSRSVYEIFNLNEASMWKLKGFLVSIYPGLTGNKIPGDIIGKVFSAVVYIDKYNGNENFRCKRFVDASGWEGVNFSVGDGGELVSTNNGAPSKPAKDKPAKAVASSASDEVEL